MRLGGSGQRLRIGTGSTARCRAWWMCCPTARSSTLPCAPFWPVGCPRSCLHLRRLGLLEEGGMTVTGRTLGENLDWWENAPRRHRFREELRKLDGVDPDDVIMDADRARSKGLTSTICFPVGNISPEGAVVKSTAIDASLLDAQGDLSAHGTRRRFLPPNATPSPRSRDGNISNRATCW